MYDFKKKLDKLEELLLLQKNYFKAFKKINLNEYISELPRNTWYKR